MTALRSRLRAWSAPLLLSAFAALGSASCKGGVAGLLISNDQEVEIGSGVDEQLEQEYKILADADPVAAWARALVSEMVPASEQFRNTDDFGGYKVEVIYDNSLVNAFAAPGGYIYIVSGLVINAGSCAEVAGVVGHELAHVTQRHSVKKLAKSSIFSSLASIILDEGISQQVVVAAYSVLQNTSHSRRDESESDKIGAQLMYESGFNPHALADMFETLKEQSGGGGGRWLAFLSSHPDPGDRANTIRERIAKDWPEVQQQGDETYLFSCDGLGGLNFEEVKQRLRDGSVTVRPGTGVGVPAQ